MKVPGPNHDLLEQLGSGYILLTHLLLVFVHVVDALRLVGREVACIERIGHRVAHRSHVGRRLMPRQYRSGLRFHQYGH